MTIIRHACIACQWSASEGESNAKANPPESTRIAFTFLAGLAVGTVASATRKPVPLCPAHQQAALTILAAEAHTHGLTAVVLEAAPVPATDTPKKKETKSNAAN